MCRGWESRSRGRRLLLCKFPWKTGRRSCWWLMVSSKCRVDNLIIFFGGQRGAPIANPISVCCASWEDLCPLGGVPLDDTTVEQSLEHLIVTRWRTSDRLPMQGMLFQILSRHAVQWCALCSVKHGPVLCAIYCNANQRTPLGRGLWSLWPL